VAEATSPDGRAWQVESHRRLRTGKVGSMDVASVVVTVILVVVTIFFARRSPAIAIIAAVMFLIWLSERASSYFRPKIDATTEGPPRQHLCWVSRSRFGSDLLEQRVIEVIKRGDPESEPPGLKLVEL
jgi:hypothetical protein